MSKILICAVSALGLAATANAGEFSLPPEVTPALRAACEKDVRRLCVGENPTLSKVKRCVRAKFAQLGGRCKVQIALAGLSP